MYIVEILKVEDEHATSESFNVMCDTYHSVAIMKHTFILAVPWVTDSLPSRQFYALAHIFILCNDLSYEM